MNNEINISRKKVHSSWFMVRKAELAWKKVHARPTSRAGFMARKAELAWKKVQSSWVENGDFGSATP